MPRKNWKVIPGVGNVDNMPWDKEKVQREVHDEFGDPGPILSRPASEKYRVGWTRTFGKKGVAHGR